MTILLNGEQSEARGARTIDELVTRFDLSPEAVLIEHNGLALHRREWPNKSLVEGDRVEFVRVVAGG
jgi:thiamine biosynthesis protein ThiS